MAESADAFIARKKADLLASPVRAKDIGRAGRPTAARGGHVARAVQPSAEGLRGRTTAAGAHLRQRAARRRAREGDVEYRLGYYTVSRSDRWWWGQYALFIPEADLQPLLDQARMDGTIL